jgi:alcohol dehydrogenase
MSGFMIEPKPAAHFGVGATHQTDGGNAAAAIDAIAALRDRIGLTAAIADFGITEADSAQIAADTLADEVLLNTPRPPTQAHIEAILVARVG